MLDDDAFADGLARVIVHVALVQRMIDVSPSRREVGEVHHHHEVEVAVEVTGVVSPRHRDEFWNLAQSFDGVTQALLRLGRRALDPSERNHLTEHRCTVPHTERRGDSFGSAWMPSPWCAKIVSVTTLDHCEVSITCGSRDEAATIADALVEAHLVACAHLAPISSVYEWNNVVEHDDEVRLTVVTRVEHFDAIVDMVRSLHSYELPAITGVALAGSAEYMAWINAQTGH